MSKIASLLSLSVVALAASVTFTTACSSGDVAVGSTSQDLKKTPSGGATGNGTNCSWTDPVSPPPVPTNGGATPGAPGSTPGSTSGGTGSAPGAGSSSSGAASGGTASGLPITSYNLGDTFKSPDGCNDCSCTAQGIACTLRACTPQVCPADAQKCPDGSYVSRTGPSCTFPACPPAVGCTDEAKQCPDGSYVGRSGPSCEFTPCPTAPPVACSQEALKCPDGSYVSRTGPSCAFAPCP